jgi:hypothetical protein
VSSPPSEQSRGHLIVRTAPAAFRWALEHAELGVRDPQEYRDRVEQLWAVLETVSPQRYRGISRDPLTRIFDGDVQSSPGVGPDWVARVKVRERLGLSPLSHDWEGFDPDLVNDLAFAREVAAATDRPGDWEVIAVEQEARERAPLTLGFDVGYWGSDHYSLISDAMLVPTWHGPDPEDFEELLPHARRLNDHQLFDSWEHASAYREWYRGRSWAESEFDDEFRVIRVDAVPPAT